MKKIVLFFVIVLPVFSFTKKEISWVAIGDSITWLNDHPDQTGNRVSKGYMTRVVEKRKNITYTNQGHNGWTSGNIAAEIEKLAIPKADVYSIFLGTNDWWQGRPLGTIRDYSNNTGNNTVYGSFRIIIDKLRQLNSAADIIFITPMQRSDFVYLQDTKNNAYGSYKEKNGQTLEQFANAVITVSNYEKYAVVDLYHKSRMTQRNLIKYKRLKNPQTGVYKNYPYPDFIGIPFNPDTDEYPYPVDAVDMTYDGLHPSDKGNGIIADMLLKVMKKYE